MGWQQERDQTDAGLWVRLLRHNKTCLGVRFALLSGPVARSYVQGSGSLLPRAEKNHGLILPEGAGAQASQNPPYNRISNLKSTLR